MVGLVVTTDNEMFKVDCDPPTYDVIHKAVGGSYEHVQPMGLESPYCMMVNKSGLLRNLPVNLFGSLLCGQPIVGKVIFLKEGCYCGEPDVISMTEDEAQTLGDEFATMTSGSVRWAPEPVEG